MLGTRSLISALLVLTAVSTALASSVVGTWHGRADLKGAKAPAGMEAKQFESMMKMAAATRVKLVFKSDKTFEATFSGSVTKTPQTMKGTWSQSGHTISLKNGGNAKKMILSRDGKVLTMTPEGSYGAKMVFKR